MLSRAAQILRQASLWPISPHVTSQLGEKLLGNRHRTGKNAALPLKDVTNILVIRLDSIGDMVLTSPLLRELRRNAKTAKITLVVNPKCKNLIETCPYIDEVLQLDTDIKGFGRPYRRYWRSIMFVRRHLRKCSFDVAIWPRWDVDSYHGTYLAYLSGAPQRAGFSETVNEDKRKWNRGYDRLLTHILSDNSVKHEVLHNLDLLRSLGGDVRDDRLELWPTVEDEAVVDRLLQNKNSCTEDPMVAIVPGAGHPKREWPLGGFEEIGLWLVRNCAVRIIIIGGPEDSFMGEKLAKALGSGAINTVGGLTLRQSAALLKRCKLLLGNDSGTMHMAAAVGIPVIELSCHPRNGSPASTHSPERFRPWRVEHTVLQPAIAKPPCTHECVANRAHCICEISPQMVKDAIAQYLARLCSLPTQPDRSKT